MATGKTCGIGACPRPVRTRGYCSTHYETLRRSGELAVRPRDPEARFWSHVEAPERGCWTWTASTSNGYGYVRRDGRLQPAHRVAYELVNGPIPEGMHIDHLCRNTACVRPLHLEPVPLRENTARGKHPSATALRTNHCLRGHEYTEANTRIDRRGRRSCRECRKLQKRESAKRVYWRNRTSG